MNISAISAMGQRSQDFEALQNMLQSGNLGGAQQAFAAFQQDVQKTAQLSGSSSLFAPGTPASRDMQTLGGALSAANLQGAQRAFATLLQDIQNAGPASTPSPLQQHHHPMTPAEVASNGVAAIQTSATAQSAGKILNLKA